MSALDWWRAVPAAATALILLLGPGLAIARSWGLRRWTAAGAAIPLGAAVVGLAEILAAGIGARWVPRGWAVIAALTCALALPGPLLRARRRARAPGGPDRSAPPRPGGGEGATGAAGASRLVTGAVGAAVCALGAALVIAMGSPTTPPQAFDAVFHLAAVGAVREGGSASSLGGLAALYQGAPVYYPSVWHGMVALLPGGAVEASNAMILVVGAVAWPLGVAGLLTEALRDGPREPGPDAAPAADPAGARRARGRAVALVTALAAATAGAPTVLLTALAVWPYALSVVALPGALALAVRARRAVARRRGRAEAAAPAVLAVLGVTLAHGTGLFNVAVLLLPVVVGGAAKLLRRGGRTRLAALVCLAAAALAAAAGAWAMRGPLTGLFGYERPGGSAAGTFFQALIDLPQYGPLASHGLPVGVVLLALAVLGLRGARDERVRPWAGAALVALVLVVLVGGPQWPGRQVGSPWYLQKSRIEPLLLIPMLVLAAQTRRGAGPARAGGRGRPDPPPDRARPQRLRRRADRLRHAHDPRGAGLLRLRRRCAARRRRRRRLAVARRDLPGPGGRRRTGLPHPGPAHGGQRGAGPGAGGPGSAPRLRGLRPPGRAGSRVLRERRARPGRPALRQRPPALGRSARRLADDGHGAGGPGGHRARGRGPVAHHRLRVNRGPPPAGCSESPRRREETRRARPRAYQALSSSWAWAMSRICPMAE